MIEQKIGFDRIRSLVASECSNTMARRMTDEMSFSTDFDRIQRYLLQTDEMRRIVMFESSFPSQDFIDLTDDLIPLKVGNTAIEQQALFNLKCSLATLTACLRFLLDDDNQDYPQLTLLARHVNLNDNLLRQANKIVDDKGEIYDNASPALFEIRRQIMRKRTDVDASLSRALSHAKQEGWAPDGAEVTIRNGRMVIPLITSHRRRIKGLIHDESATHQTAYLEPSDVVELNNDLRELEFAENHEIQRILLSYSELLRPELPNLLAAYWFLARIDFLRAKARVALSMNAGMPLLANTAKIDWLDARHPLLYLQREADGHRGNEVVPFNITLADPQRILIVSGPNAGGKSVCLKAIGLIQYMLQCGMLVPCRPTSEFGIFGSIFIDIGDGQSVDDDLSTYSSHLQNMRQLLQHADSRTLFLLDELGSGTEPRSGCAIAEAMLEELDSRGSFGVATTHYADLKLLADTHPSIVNGAMLFDTDRLKPLYQLSIGHPGSSFAFEIAQSVGFPQQLLDNAAAKVGNAMLNFEHQLQQLEVDRRKVAEQQAQVDAADKFLAEVIAKYENLNNELQEQRQQYISQARQEARQIIADANRTVEKTISDIKTAQAEKEQTQLARQQLQAHAQQLAESQQHDIEVLRHATSQPASNGKQRRKQKQLGTPQQQTVSDIAPDKEITPGTIVRIDGQETYGEVVEIKGSKAVLQSNSLTLTIALNRLTPTNKQHLPADKSSRKTTTYQSIYNELGEKRKSFNPTLDLRGQRADEALANLQHYIYDALLLNERELRILHGKGNGILKQVLRQWLQSSPDVASFRSEHVEFGGDGITIVTLQ